MLFAAKSAAPFAAQSVLHRRGLDKAAEGARTLFTTPPGYLLSDSLVLALTERARPTLWLRLGPEDRDPATLLISLIASAQRLRPGIGSLTLQQMRQRPGTVAGWPSLFETLAREFAETLPPSSAIVLEQVHHLKQAPSTLGLLGINFLQDLPQHIPCILISQGSLPTSVLPPQTVICGIDDLRVDTQDGLAIAKDAGSGLSKDCVRRAIYLVEGRVVALAGLLSAEETLGTDFIQRTINRSKNADHLLASIARASLSTVDPNNLQALAMAIHLEYSHPALLEATLNKQTTLVGPWIQPLSDGWSRIRRVWQAPLYSTLRIEMASNFSALHRAADYLVGQGALDRAVPLYFQLGDTDSAARVIAGITTQLTNLGQWETLNHWLTQLPSEVFQDWPWLLYTRGEIHTLQGHLKDARKTFAEAASIFSARYEEEGACQSLLAESAVAAWDGDVESARSHALTASAKAQSAGLKSLQSWAAWQLGCLNTAAGDLEAALAYFSQASDAIHSPFIAGLFQQVEALALKQHELRRQTEFHRQAYLNFQRAEQETSAELISLTSSPPDNLAGLLSVYGWSNTPLILKLSAPVIQAEEIQAPEKTSLLAGLLHTLGIRWNSGRPGSVENDKDELAGLEIPFHILPDLENNLPTPQVSKPAAAAIFAEVPTTSTLPDPTLTSTESLLYAGAPAIPPVKPAPLLPEARLAVATEEKSSPRLTAYLLGAFRVSIDDRAIEKWPGSRGLAVLKYLLANFGEEISRDVLMDIFWPDASPDAARNNLNVALHNLRQAFRAALQEPVVVFERGNYHLNPALIVWTDVDEFERHFQAGRQLESAGQVVASQHEYEVASSLYLGDFLADDPYEEWPVITRERLRVMCLEALDRLSRIYFSQGQFTACATLCQRILERDDCREDAHCRLMRCYSRQGQHNLALRQYQACVEALRAQLDVEPEQATTQLAERIRQRKQV
jgi:DNA-binding SARP family transcriptional activator